MKQTLINQNNEGEMFLRNEHPDTRTVKQWKADVYAKTGVLWAKPKSKKKKTVAVAKKVTKKSVKKVNRKKVTKKVSKKVNRKK
jgi:hypothetical protein